MRLDDEVRLEILDALLLQGSVSANVKQIQKRTGYHKATIKSSLDFLGKEGLISGFGPKFDFRKFGYKLEVLMFIQADLGKKDLLERFLKEAKSDESLYFLSGIMGSGNWNMLARFIYKDVESFHEGIIKKYFEKIPKIHDFIRDKEVFYVTDPFYKTESRTGSLVRAVKKSRGFD